MSEVREIVGIDPAAVTQWLDSLDLEFVGPLSLTLSRWLKSGVAQLGFSRRYETPFG